MKNNNMKQILTMIFFILSCGLAFGQLKKSSKPINKTKEKKVANTIPKVNSNNKIQTEEWIKEKIENFTHEYNQLNGHEYGIEKYEVEFSNGNIIIRKKRDGKSLNIFTEEWKKSYAYYFYEIPIKELSKLNFVSEGNSTRIYLKIKSNEPKINQTIETFVSAREQNKINTAIFYIPDNLLGDNLPERLTKAFDNLIQIYGGKVTSEIF